MTEEEKKLYSILHSSFCRIAEAARGGGGMASVSFLGKVFDGPSWIRLQLSWEHRICHNLGAIFTSMRRNPMENFYVSDPSRQIIFLGAVYIEINKEIGLKILTLGYLP
jgi:hypothetical protein